MSKFCGNCGAELDESANVCGYCGASVNSDSTTEKIGTKKIPGIKTEREQEKIRKIKIISKLTFASIIIVVLAIIGVNIGSSFVGYKGAVRKIMNAYEDYDMNTLISMASDLHYYSADENYVDDNFSDIVAERLNSLENSVGHNVKIDYEITDSFELPEYRLDELLSQFESYGIDTSDIKKIMQVELLIKAKGNKSTNTYNSDGLLLVKEKGDWKAIYTGYMNYLY